jgi:plasmid maintenance system antidote protein VapI
MEAHFWINLQADYDLRKASRENTNIQKTIHPAKVLLAR